MLKPIKGFAPTNTREFKSSTPAAPPFKPGMMKEMPTAAPTGMNGSGFKLTSNAKYGVDGYDSPEKVTAMSRKTMKSAGGSGASSLPPSKNAKFGIDGYGGTDSVQTGGVPKGMKYADGYGVGGVAGGGGQGGNRSSLSGPGGTR